MWNHTFFLNRNSLRTRFHWCRFVGILAVAFTSVAGFLVQPTWAQFNENCFVSILNRTAQVQPNGAWEILNIPSGFGPVRARATCLENGVTVRGQSDLFSITLNQTTGLQPFPLGVVAPIPVSLTVSAPLTIFTAAGATAQVTTFATLPDATIVNVTAATTGTVYSTSNATIASVTSNGLVTAMSSGAVLITARNEGAIGLVQLQVQLSGDSDGDGIPDDQELALGLDPNDPLDALDDADQDGLTAAQEIALGTNLFLADTDGDGIADGEEVVAGADGFITQPLLPDTDGDGLRDGLEVATGSDPTDPNSFNLAQALAAVQVSPSAFTLTFNQLLGDVSTQLVVTGVLIDQTTIDLTASSRGTNYTSNDLTVCNFGAMDGVVFAGMSGNCLITVSNSGFTSVVDGVVQNFEPVALSFLDLPGTAHNVEVHGDYAYLASFSNGVHIIDISNRAAPSFVNTIPSPQVWDVKIMGTHAYMAEGAASGSRLRIVDVVDPLTPVEQGEVELPAFPLDLAVSGPLAFAAMGADGLQVIDITRPEAPRLLGQLDTGNTILAVAIDEVRQLAILAGSAGLTVVDVSNPSQPVILGNAPSTGLGGSHRQVELLGTLAFVANRTSGLHVVDLTVPSNPTTLTNVPIGLAGELEDVALAGAVVFGAERTTFANLVPILSSDLPIVPQLRGNIDFSAFATLAIGINIAVDGSFVYLSAGDTFPDTNRRLYIGQYLDSIDADGLSPVAALGTPTPGQTIKEGSILPIIVEASDDVSLQAVEFLVEGQVVFTDTTFPYQYDAPVPVGITDMTVAARAIDLGGNQTPTAEVIVTVQPDLLTTVIGTVVDSNGIPVAGAQVITAGGVSGATGIDGTFSLANVPTLFDSSASATLTRNGAVSKGSSLLVPSVPQGITDVGQFSIVTPDICEDECVPL